MAEATMLRRRGYFVTLGLLFAAFLLSANADNSVHILSKYHQLLTSTTLKWLPVAHYNPDEPKEIVVGGFEIATDDEADANQAEKSEVKRRPLYVCRAVHNGVWVAGTQKERERRCTVTMHGMVESYEKYELLENVDGAARIAWVYWDRYLQSSVGAVYVDKTLIARREASGSEKSDGEGAPRYTHYIGTLSSYDNFGSITYVNENGNEESAKTGELLVETEPIRYELSAVKLNWAKKRDLKRSPRVLVTASIANERSQAANMAEACAYSYKYSIYWGRKHAILNGMSTTIKLANGTSLSNVTWGMRHEENRTDAYNVAVFLEPGTGVNVTLRANYTDMEVPYSATLISHYEDGATTSRVIGGYRQEETMFDVTPEFGPVYFLSNYSLVPTTVAPPTTEPPTTTTTTTMTTMTTTTITTTMKQQDGGRMTGHRHRHTDGGDDNDDDDDDEDMSNDENLIVPPKKTDISTGMQSGDGGPLSLKNKVEVKYSGACGAYKPSLLLTLVAPLLLLLILHRIT